MALTSLDRIFKAALRTLAMKVSSFHTETTTLECAEVTPSGQVMFLTMLQRIPVGFIRKGGVSEIS